MYSSYLYFTSRANAEQIVASGILLPSIGGFYPGSPMAVEVGGKYTPSVQHSKDRVTREDLPNECAVLFEADERPAMESPYGEEVAWTAGKVQLPDYPEGVLVSVPRNASLTIYNATIISLGAAIALLDA